jgi:hypothetical protein
MSVAAQVAARKKRGKRGGMPAATQGSGNVYSGDANGGNLGVGAEIYLDGQGWVDISPYIYYRDGATMVSISRGRGDEISTTQPQTCSFQLNDRDARFSPRNPLGPYYGIIGRNTPIRFFRYSNGVKVYRFAGEVPAWPVNTDITDTDVYSPLTAYGQLRRLVQGTPLTQSAMYRAYSKWKTSGLGNVNKYSRTPANVVGYWPCEDEAGASSISAGLAGLPPILFNAAPTFASNSNFPCSKPLPVTNNSKWQVQLPVSGVTWQDNVMRFLMQIPSGGDTDGAVIARFYTNGTVAHLDLVYNTTGSGGLTLKGYNIAGTNTITVGPFSNLNGVGWNGTATHASMELKASGANVVVQWESTDVVNSNADLSAVINGTLSSASVGAITSLQIDPNGNLASTAIGHISVQSVYNTMDDTGNAVGSWGEDGTDRLVRLCLEDNVNQVTVHGVVPTGSLAPGGLDAYGDTSGFDYPSLMGNQLPDTLLNLIQQCIDVDTGILFEARDQVALAWRPRVTLYNQETAYSESPFNLTLDYAQNQLSSQAIPQDDDYYTHNDVTAQQINGATARQSLDSGTMSTQAAPNGVGEYQTTYSLNVGPDGNFAGQMSLADHAGWRLHLGTVDEPRYPSVAVNLRNAQFTSNQNLTNAVLALDIGDVIVINNPPAWLPPGPLRLIVQGIQEVMGAFEHDLVFNCSPESPYRVAVLDDAVLAAADTDGSTLSAPLGTVLNSNPLFAGGSVNEWSAVSGSISVFGTSGSSNPLPAGGPTGYGIMLTPDGSLSNCAVEGGSAAGFYIPSDASVTYQVSALVYSPTGYANVEIGFDWYDANQGYLSTSSVLSSVAANTWTALSTFAMGVGAYLRPRIGEKSSPASSNTLYIATAVVWRGMVMVATANSSSPLWTTGAADFPFDITVGGERMTVTSISGSSSPQTFTVARAVNAVAKAQTVGTDVRLFQPMILSL